MNTLAQQPAAVNAQSVAFRFGKEAAQRGESCVPEMIFVARRDQINFAAGYEAVNGVNFTTAQFTGSALPKPRTAQATAERVFQKLTARGNRLEAMLAKTAAETPECAGDILWAV